MMRTIATLCVGTALAIMLPQESVPAQYADKVWMRTDGQRITGNPKLERQDKEDRTACLALTKENQTVDKFIGCMAAKGYALVPKDEAEDRLKAAAAAHTPKQKVASPPPIKKNGDGRTPATERLIECVKREAFRYGTGYTSSDGGLSAARIMLTCKEAWAAYADECVAELKAGGKREREPGGHQKGCNLAGAAMAQAALIYIGK
jgi:hypothetical protein